MIDQKLEKKPIRIFIYYRISTELQNFKAQKKIIETFLDHNDKKYQIIDIFKDSGKSGILAPQDRPEFNEMINRLDEIDAILCYDWDRISRDVKFANYFMFFLKEADIFIIEGNSGKTLNFDEMGDRIWTYLKSEMSAYERERIKERQKAGIEAFRKEHESKENPKGRWGPKKKYGGGPNGDKWNKKKFWEKYETLRLANVSKSAIARLFRVSNPTLYKRLKEEPEKYDSIERKVKEKFLGRKLTKEEIKQAELK